MKKVVLYIAMSLDGYIARQSGKDDCGFGGEGGHSDRTHQRGGMLQKK